MALRSLSIKTHTAIKLIKTLQEQARCPHKIMSCNKQTIK